MMKIKSLVILLLLLCWGSLAYAQEQFLVYDVSGRVNGFGLDFSTQQDPTHGESHETWRGKYLYDIGSGKGAIIWHANLQKVKTRETIEFGLSLRNFEVQGRPGVRQNVFSLASAQRLTDFPDANTSALVILIGNTVKNIDINRTHTTDSLPISAEVSTLLKGSFWILDKDNVSYRAASISARLNLKDTYMANEKLWTFLISQPERPQPVVATFADLLTYWDDIYRTDWNAVTESPLLP